MATFASVIPQEFFTVSQEEQLASNQESITATNTVNGSVTVRKENPYSGAIFITWDRKSPKFQENLDKCRSLKPNAFYRPQLTGWTVNPLIAKQVIETFPDLFISSEVRKLAETVVAPPPVVVSQYHGTITQNYGNWVVLWNNCPKDDFSTYLTAARDIKAAVGGIYNGTTKAWSFPRTAAGRIVASFPSPQFLHSEELLKDAVLYPVPKPQVIEEIQSEETLLLLRKYESTNFGSRELFQHQKDGIKWILSCKDRIASGENLKGIILADDMGLGKSLTALCAAKVVGLPIHVIAPKSLGINWQREAKMAGVRISGLYANHVASFPKSISTPFILIVDEAHAFQEMKSKRTKTFLELAMSENCVGVYLLSGTPIKNGRPCNLLPLLKAINHGIVATEDLQWKYLNRYCGPQRVCRRVKEEKDEKKKGTFKGQVTTFLGATNLKELHSLCKPAILRRMKKDCLDLPPKIRTLIQAELSPEETELYNRLVFEAQNSYKVRLQLGQIRSGGDKLVALTNYRKIGSISKVPTAISIAEDVLEEGGQIVIFTAFKESVAKIASHFGVSGYTGETSPVDRQKLVDEFQSGKSKVFVGTGAAAGTGTTLLNPDFSQTVLLMDRSWSPGDAEQWEDRCHRIGQTGTVNAIWLQYGPVDEKIDNLLMTKSENISQVLLGNRTRMSFASESDIACEAINILGWEA